MISPPKVAILGSTGSIGRSTLDVIASHPERFQLELLSAHRDWESLEAQVLQFAPRSAFLTGPRTAEIDAWLSRSDPRVVRCHGMPALVETLRGDGVQIVVAAIVGIAGLHVALAAAETGKRLALANKESLVVAGELLLRASQRSGAEILPIDSEHSAIFQALQGHRSATSRPPNDSVRRLILTASGGPLRDWPIEKLADATVEDALSHPTWSMGRKITVDSATMMNKALEVIEARWLFDIPAEQIEVVLHPQSMVHSMVEFVDGSVLAQVSPPDMRLPIQYALTYPERLPCPARQMDWTQSHRWEMHPVDPERYPALELGFEVARRGGTCGAVLNAANESAVEWFLQKKIRLTEIAAVCRSVLDHHDFSPSPSLDELLAIDRWARHEVNRWIRIPC